MSDETAAQSSLGHIPKGPWEFDAEVTRCFDDMLARSIPQYPVMRRAVFDAACRFVKPGTDIVDLGCSRGEAMAALVERFPDGCRHVGLDVSGPMLDAARERFKGQIESGSVRIFNHDLRTGLPLVRASVVQAVLTLQFTPMQHRPRIVQAVHDSLVPGGAFILVEKVLGRTALLDSLLVETYHALKERNGYSREEIDRKALSLEGVLVPVTAKWNEELLHDAGFRQVECIWRWMNFAAWVAVK